MIEQALNKKIEQDAKEFCSNDHITESPWERDRRHYEAGANSIKGLLLEAYQALELQTCDYCHPLCSRCLVIAKLQDFCKQAEK